MVLQSAISGAINIKASKQTISYVSHPFVAQDILRYNGSAWVKAKADTIANAEVGGIVESATTDDFVLVMSGNIVISTASWTAGAIYRLSDVTAGLLTTTDAAAGTVHKPVLYTTSSTTGIVIQSTGYLVQILSQSADGLYWNTATGATNLIANNAYLANSTSQVVFTLPATASLYQRFKVVGKGTGGWKIAQNASQVIHFLGVDTTTGTGGSITNSGQYDSIEIICTVANTDFTVIGAGGSPDVV